MTKGNYHVLWDIGHTCDGLPDTFDSVEDAIPSALMIYDGWIEAAFADEYSADEWNEMIETCSAWVSEYDPRTDEYEEVWGLTDECAREIGWTLREE